MLHASSFFPTVRKCVQTQQLTSDFTFFRKSSQLMEQNLKSFFEKLDQTALWKAVKQLVMYLFIFARIINQ